MGISTSDLDRKIASYLHEEGIDCFYPGLWVDVAWGTGTFYYSSEFWEAISRCSLYAQSWGYNYGEQQGFIKSTIKGARMYGYEEKQLSDIPDTNPFFKVRLKLKGDDKVSETNWLSLNDKQLAAVKRAILENSEE
jgi:hypothetical protein